MMSFAKSQKIIEQWLQGGSFYSGFLKMLQTADLSNINTLYSNLKNTHFGVVVEAFIVNSGLEKSIQVENPLPSFRIYWKKCIPSVGPVFYQGIVGKSTLFSIHMNIRRDQPNWVLSSTLPGLKEPLQKHNEVESLQRIATGILSFWLKRTIVEISDDTLSEEQSSNT